MRHEGRKARIGAASLAALLLCGWSTMVAAGPAADPLPDPSASGLVAFTSAAELAAWLQQAGQDAGPEGEPCMDPNPEVCPRDDASVDEVVVTATRASAPSITNNQQGGVDEGDLVKLRGDTLVILRRGRLFTVSLTGGRMRPVDTAKAYPPASMRRRTGTTRCWCRATGWR